MPHDFNIEFHDYYIARSVLDLFIYWLRTAPFTEVMATLRWPVDLDGLALDLCRQHQRMLELTDRERAVDEEEPTERDQADVRSLAVADDPHPLALVAQPLQAEAACCEA
jgi:hypothetical protein